MRTLFIPLVAAVLVVPVMTPATAEADCDDAVLCAELEIGSTIALGAQVQISQPRAQVVVVRPARPAPPPPVIVVQPAQPAPPPPPPPPPVEYPSQGPVVVTSQPIANRAPAPRLPRPRNFGIHGFLVGSAGTVDMGGGGASFRFRPNLGRFALDIGGAVLRGVDANGDDRVEIPFNVDTRLYFNPGRFWQFYGVAGFHLSIAETEIRRSHSYYENRTYMHAGAQAGLGSEVRFGPAFAINADFRGLIRHRIDGHDGPEFVDDSGRATDTSGGFIATLGATVYF